MTDLPNDAVPAGARLPLTRSQIWMSVLLGAVLWFAAATLLRLLEPLDVFAGSGRLIVYLLVVPGTFPFILLVQRLAKLGRAQVGLGVAVATAAATLLDGIALAWFPGLYGVDVAHIAASGAVILWGAGVGMVIGFLLNRAGPA